MLLGAAVALLFCGVLGLVLRPWLGTFAAVVGPLLLWSLVVIALVTLIPAQGPPGIVPAEGRLPGCSWDIGGPAPEGFWIFASGQRVLNALLFVPSGVLLVLTVTRWRTGWLLVPIGLAGLMAYSIAIETVQLTLARIDRACDVTDVIDNVIGATVGVLLGILLALVLRPWRRRGRRRSALR